MASWQKASKDDVMSRAAVRWDGWANIYTGMGLENKDKATGKFFKKRIQLGEETISALYADEGMGKKLVDLPVDTMFKNWVKIESDTQETFAKVYEKIGLKKRMKKHCKWSRAHGGSLLLAGMSDGTSDFELPVNYGALKTIDFFQVYDRWRVYIDPTDYETNENNVRYGKPEFYTIRGFGGDEFKVHYSRCHILSGELVPAKYQSSVKNVWGNSIYQALFDYITRFGTMGASVDSIIDDFIQTIVQIENLQQLVHSGQDKEVKDRMKLIGLGKSMIKTVVLDSKENYTKQASSVSGLADLVRETYIILAAVSNIPVTLLMGRSPAGQNSTGEADFKAWYDYIETLQEEQMLDCFKWINDLIVNCSGYKVSTKEPLVTFLPLVTPTLEELLKSKKQQADIDYIYWQMNVLSEEEIRQARFGGDEYSFDMNLLKRVLPPRQLSKSTEEKEE